MASDGWKKKAANKGEPLVNAVALKPDGGAIFLDVFRPGSQIKDGAWIADVHEEMFKKLIPTDGDDPLAYADQVGLVLGVVMDNAAANSSGMNLLSEKHPEWVVVGCQAHALNLLFKDLVYECGEGSAGTASIMQVVQTISLVYGDCFVFRDHLAQVQKEKNLRVKGIRSHVPTRWAILYLTALDVLACKESLRALVESIDRWAAVEAASKNAESLHVMRNYEFWLKLDSVMLLLHPISDAIHQLESDRPLLSQVLPMWYALMDHAREWTLDPCVDESLKAEVWECFKRRYHRHYQDIWAAAFLLDPINFVVCGDDVPRPDFLALTKSQLVDAMHVVCRLAHKAASLDAINLVKKELNELEIGDLSEDAWGRPCKAFLERQRGDAAISRDMDRIVVPSVGKRRN
eukprot:347728-Chlamydomonas_euryale.AAC.1